MAKGKLIIEHEFTFNREAGDEELEAIKSSLKKEGKGRNALIDGLLNFFKLFNPVQGRGEMFCAVEEDPE